MAESWAAESFLKRDGAMGDGYSSRRGGLHSAMRGALRDLRRLAIARSTFRSAVAHGSAI